MKICPVSLSYLFAQVMTFGSLLNASNVYVDPQREDTYLQQEQTRGMQFEGDKNLEQERTTGLQFTGDQFLQHEQTRDLQFEEDKNLQQERERERM